MSVETIRCNVWNKICDKADFCRNNFNELILSIINEIEISKDSWIIDKNSIPDSYQLLLGYKKAIINALKDGIDLKNTSIYPVNHYLSNKIFYDFDCSNNNQENIIRNLEYFLLFSINLRLVLEIVLKMTNEEKISLINEFKIYFDNFFELKNEDISIDQMFEVFFRYKK
ncbi:MAG: hypothetical protein ACD_4C00348G0004 [uncultured bacterium (gcode 4)]|uniref:Uncharacterized protein n=1 Tax=uncultured bacterium (gcode 4) TaxID=1234023 RepID=K2G858_9BACT|nr:MAG: hypothetical protein ACD_4C00348G0004 [uncultured bacterium (gcode 4)]